MARYYFDILDHTLTRDEEGLEFADPRDAAKHALQALPMIVAHEAMNDQDAHDTLTVHVRDESDTTIYSATLTCVGTWLTRCTPRVPNWDWLGRVNGLAKH